MTVKELIDAATFCESVEIIVRENGCGQWIHGYRIGENVEMFPAECTAEFRDGATNYLRGNQLPKMTSGEIRDIYHAINLPMRIIKKKVSSIPDSVSGLTVCYFQPMNIPVLHKSSAFHNSFTMEIDCYPDGYQPDVLESKSKQESEQLEGQTDIFDFIGGTK